MGSSNINPLLEKKKVTEQKKIRRRTDKKMLEFQRYMHRNAEGIFKSIGKDGIAMDAMLWGKPNLIAIMVEYYWLLADVSFLFL